MFLEYLFITARPKQWIKNCFLFASLVFGQAYLAQDSVIKSCLGFVIFCLLSSSVYFLNDIIDIERDRSHPVKCKRPLPAGNLKVGAAIVTLLLLLSIAFVGAAFLDSRFLTIAVAYFLLNVFYSMYLKHVVIIDVLLIAIGFVLRMVAGALVIQVPISPWLYLCTILIALFLALAKRRHEIVLLEDNANTHRAILDEYSPYFLDQMIAVVTSSALMAYSLYTIAPDVVSKFHTANLKFTIPFVIYGIFRYLFLVHQKEKGGSPTEIILTDKPLMINVLLWFITCVIIIQTA